MPSFSETAFALAATVPKHEIMGLNARHCLGVNFFDRTTHAGRTLDALSALGAQPRAAHQGPRRTELRATTSSKTAAAAASSQIEKFMTGVWAETGASA